VAKTKGKLDLNPKAKEEWGIPTGKKFGNYFSPAKTKLKPNCIGWPTFPHQVTKTDHPMCRRFRMTGEYTMICGNAHALPSKMNPKAWADMKARIKDMIGN
jgi:hypothetical protein